MAYYFMSVYLREWETERTRLPHVKLEIKVMIKPTDQSNFRTQNLNSVRNRWLKWTILLEFEFNECLLYDEG